MLLTRTTWTPETTPEGTTYRHVAPGGARAEIRTFTDRAVLREDVVRSFPLYYASSIDGEWFVSDDPQHLVATLGVHGLSTLDAGEFRHLGYVSGPTTLHPGVSQIESGETMELRDGERARTLDVRSIGATGENLHDEQAVDARFSAALASTFSNLLERLDGRQVVVPLSGGLDSRLIAVVLKDLGYENVVNFTYGVGQTRESDVSRTVADAVGQRWEFVPYDVGAMRAAWADGAAAAFVADTYAGASLPHIQDWYALRYLREHALIDESAVFLPGHTVVGNMHDETILDTPRELPASTVRDTIIRHHAVLQPRSADTLGGHSRFAAKIDAELARLGYDGSPLARLIAIESWNIRERQAKYINNSMRAYEHFGYEWALPMLEEPVLQAWESFDISVRRNRDWYAGYIARRYQATTGSSLATYAPTALGTGTRARIKAVLRATGLLTMVERRFVANAYAAHPMGFQSYVPASEEHLLRRTIMRGGNPFGVFADRFLADEWVPGQSLFG